MDIKEMQLELAGMIFTTQQEEVLGKVKLILEQAQEPTGPLSKDELDAIEEGLKELDGGEGILMKK